GEPRLVQRIAGVPVHRRRGLARGDRDPPHRLACAPAHGSLGLWLPGPQPDDPIHRRQLRAADPPGVRQRGVPRRRDGGDAAARRDAPGATREPPARRHLGRALCADRPPGRGRRRPAQHPAVPHHPPLPEPGVPGPGGAAPGVRPMGVIADLLVQGGQMALVLALAPLLTGWIRLVKSRLLGRRGASALQPYRDLLRLLRKEAVIAHTASWLFRVVPYLVFAATWVAAALIPTFATGPMFSC